MESFETLSLDRKRRVWEKGVFPIVLNGKGRTSSWKTTKYLKDKSNHKTLGKDN
jgi:hypothetical protein